MRMADAILRKNPVDADALALMRKATVAQTITKGNWETPAPFREKLKERNGSDVNAV